MLYRLKSVIIIPVLMALALLGSHAGMVAAAEATPVVVGPTEATATESGAPDSSGIAISPMAAVANAITGISAVESSIGSANTPFSLDIAWSVPDSAASGDTFTLDLGAVTPVPMNTPNRSFPIYAPDGVTLVGTASIVNNIMTVTLSQYADINNNVTGTIRLGNVRFDTGYGIDGTTVDITFPGGFTDAIDVGAPVNTGVDYKFGVWGATTSSDPESVQGVLKWQIAVNHDHTYSTMTYTENAPSGWTIDCSSIQIFHATEVSRTCTPTSMVIQLTNVGTGVEQSIVRFTGTPTVQQSSYFNSVVQVADGVSSTLQATILTPADAGTGIGNLPTPTPIPTATPPTPTATATIAPTATPTATTAPPTATATTVPPTPTATVAPPTATATVMPPTPNATTVPPTPFATMSPTEPATETPVATETPAGTATAAATPTTVSTVTPDETTPPVSVTTLPTTGSGSGSEGAGLYLGLIGLAVAVITAFALRMGGKPRS